MMTRPALLGRTVDTYFGKKHLYVAEVIGECLLDYRLKRRAVKDVIGFNISL